jgi:hypothetical protein
LRTRSVISASPGVDSTASEGGEGPSFTG